MTQYYICECPLLYQRVDNICGFDEYNAIFIPLGITVNV